MSRWEEKNEKIMGNLIFKSIEGNDIIEFISFNFDGKGNAIVRRNGDIELLEVDELKDVLFGAVAEEKQYIEFSNDNLNV